MTGPKHLKDIYYNHVIYGRSRGRDGKAPDTLESDIDTICRQVSARLRDGSYRFTQYRQVLISKGAGKAPRVISIPTARDRIALKSIAELLSLLFPSRIGVIPQRRVYEVGRSLQGSDWDTFVKLDIERFYDSIPHEILFRRLRERFRKREILSLVASALKTPTVPDGSPRSEVTIGQGVPQGLPVSNLLAEIVAGEVDDRFSGDSRGEYFRFVDDVLFLCNRANSVETFDRIEAAFGELGLSVHPPEYRSVKSGVGDISGGFDYLGYRFSGDTIAVRPESVRSLESSIASLLTRYKHDLKIEDPYALRKCIWRLNLRISGCIYKEAHRGWMQYFRQTNDLLLLKKIDVTVRKMVRRFGLPEEVRLKSFVRTYWSLHYPKGDYVPNFDTFSIGDAREVVVEIFGDDEARFSGDSHVRSVFFHIVEREVSQMRTDVGMFS